MSLFKKKLKVDSIHISTPLFSVGLSASETPEQKRNTCKYDVVLGDILAIQGIDNPLLCPYKVLERIHSVRVKMHNIQQNIQSVHIEYISSSKQFNKMYIESISF